MFHLRDIGLRFVDLLVGGSARDFEDLVVVLAHINELIKSPQGIYNYNGLCRDKGYMLREISKHAYNPLR